MKKNSNEIQASYSNKQDENSWQISIWNKSAQHHMLLGNYKLMQWDTTTHQY